MKKPLLLVAAISMVLLASAQTTVTLQPDPVAGNDASLGYHDNFNTSSNNYGNDTYLKAFCIPGASGGQNINRGVIKFDLSSIPTAAVVQSADLYLYATGYINSLLPGHFGNNASTLERITSAWSESTVTWNSAPTTTTAGAAAIPQSTSATQDYIISVVAMTQYQVANPILNYGFLFRLNVENSATPAALLFYTSDHTDPNARPKLIVTYNDSINPKSVHTIVVEAIHMEVFPNPSTQFVRITTGELHDAVVNVYSAEGKLVKSVTYAGILSTFYLPVADIANGSYILEIISENKKGTAKFIKE